MASELRFDNKVVVITGAGNGLGKSHALLFGSRGAKVVVNDLGSTATGGGKSSAAADKVVEEIKAAGGQAVANYDSVEDGDKIIKTAKDAFGKVDIVVNNAGILRDSSFQKMSQEDWDLIYRVHVLGAYRVTRAAWDAMREQGYGRIILTASAAGLYGNFGQANYSMAKMGLVGFGQTLALEGVKRGIHTNIIAPVAGSRLTETIMPKEIVDALKPEYVSPLVAWLCHESCEENGGIFEVGGGFIGKLRWERTVGKLFPIGRPLSVEQVQGAWSAVTDFEKATHPENVHAALQPVLANLEKKSKGGNEFIDVDAALGYTMDGLESKYDERDLALYALGVGAGKNPTDEADLHLVYERNGEGFYALPTYGVIPAINAILTMALEGKGAPGLNYSLDRILHGEQYTEVLQPLPTKATTLVHKMRISDIFDKGKNAVVVFSIESRDKETGTPLVKNDISMIVRGAGGWGGDRGPSGDLNVPPDRKPDAVVTEKIGEGQALLYRLSGDWNPLHVDPSFAAAFGFERPILHGLCTFGHVGRHVINSFCKGDPRFFKSIKVRFADSVFPGETLKTEMWKDGDRVIVKTTVVERNKVAISNAAVELYKEIPQPKAAPAPSASAPAAAPASSGPSSADVFAAIGAYVSGNPELTKTVQNVYRFTLKGGAAPNVWTVDLKNGGGAVAAGGEAKADCTLELSEGDFLDMVQGKVDPQKLFTTGKLKIGGNIMASQKLEFLRKLDKSALEKGAAAKAASPAVAAPTAAGSTASSKSASAPKVIAALKERLQKNGKLAEEVRAAVQFVVREPDTSFGVDLQKGPGSLVEGKLASPTVTLTLADEDLLVLAKGELGVNDLYQHGKLRIDGSVAAAHRLGFLQKLV